MLSYHNDPSLKAKFVTRMQAHIVADEVIQGTGFECGRGCAVGCTYNKFDHALGPERLGFPLAYEYLRDVIFEGLPAAEAPAFALASLEAVPVGVDMSGVVAQHQVLMLRRSLVRLADNREPHAEECEAAIQDVIDWLLVGSPESTAQAAVVARAAAAWSAVAGAVAGAVLSAALSAAESAASASASAAASAAELAAFSATLSSAWSAAVLSAASAAGAAEYRQQRDDLLQIVRSLK